MSLSGRGRSPIYKPCQILVLEVGVRSVGEKRCRPGHKPEGYGTAFSVPAVGANVDITRTWRRETQDTPSIKGYLVLPITLS